MLLQELAGGLLSGQRHPGLGKVPEDPGAPELSPVLCATALVFAAKEESQEIHFSARETLLWTYRLIFTGFLRRQLTWKKCSSAGLA